MPEQKVAVLPVPDCACWMTSRPCVNGTIPRCWMAEGFSKPVQTSCQNRRKRISKWVPITLMWTSWGRVCQLTFMLKTLSTFSCKPWTWWFSLMCTITIGKTPQNCRSCKTNSVPSNRHRPQKLSKTQSYQSNHFTKWHVYILHNITNKLGTIHSTAGESPIPYA